MSHCLRAIVAAKIAVSVPITTTVSEAAGAAAKSAELRATR